MARLESLTTSTELLLVRVAVSGFRHTFDNVRVGVFLRVFDRRELTVACVPSSQRRA